MVKWKNAIPVIIPPVVVIVFLTIAVMKESLEQSLYKIPSGLTCPGSVGTNVGPGQGSLYFEINGGKTRVETTSVLNKMPEEGESILATVCLGAEIGGEVQNITAVHQNRAIATILSTKGLITVGVVVTP